MQAGAISLVVFGQSLDLQQILIVTVDWVQTHWAPIADAINSARPSVEPIIWVAGAILALVPGTVAIYKWLYYRRSRLPQRFEEMLVEEEDRLKTARKVLLERIQHPESIKPFKAPIFVEPSLAKAMRALKWVGWWNGKALSTADEKLKSALDEIEGRMRSWDDHRSHQLEQQATALLLRGAIAAASAEKERAAGKDGDARNREALGYFLKALEIDATDIEALEYAAHQHRMLGEVDDAIEFYDRLAEHTEKPGAEMALVRMRALRYKGEMYERRFDSEQVALDLTRAKESLERALETMPQIARGELIEAFTRRWLGSVEDKKNTATLWRAQYGTAETIFLDLIRRRKHVREAEAGLEEVRTLRDAAVKRREVPSALAVASPPPPATPFPK